MKELTYKEYVEKCRKVDTGFDVSTFTLDVNGKKLGIELPEDYDKTVSMIAKAVGRRIQDGSVETDARGIATKVMDALTLRGVEKLGEHFAKELSEKLYGGECFVNHVHPYRNNITKDGEAASWIWHYDDVAPGIIKVMVYLTDTTKNTGAFLVLRNEEDDYPIVEPSKISPSEQNQPKWPKSRVPGKVINSYKRKGYKEHYIEGSQGTFIVFNNNIVHKGTIPTQKPERHCIIFQFRPYHRDLDFHIGTDITWDWKSKVNSKTYHYDIIEIRRWKETRKKK